jgi:adenosylcobyric acid synthase
MPACLYAVGVGPGDPELLTLKAVRVLRAADVIVAPTGSAEATSYALGIVAEHLDRSRQLVLERVFPMVRDEEELPPHWQATASEVADHVRAGRAVALVTTGDPLLDSTFRCLLRILRERHADIAIESVPGVAAAEARTGLAVLDGVPRIDLERTGQVDRDPLRIGVVRLPCSSNDTDFDSLEHEADVDLRYVTTTAGIAGLDLLILLGTKNTLAGLQFLRSSGLALAIHEYHAGGGRVAGICGGYQMLGRRIADPDGVESDLLEAEGLGLLDVETVLTGDKQAHQVNGTVLEGAAVIGLGAVNEVVGYEIHMGVTTHGALARPLFAVARFGGFGETFEDGAVSLNGHTWGTYLHGLFDDDALCHALLDDLRSHRGLEATTRPAGTSLDV